MATPTNLKVDGLNFEQIKDNLKEFLKTRDNFVDVNFEASGIQMLLDVLAYNTYYNATYLNLASNESFLATAQRRNSIVNLARTLNYTPRSTTSARVTGTLAATISGGAPSFVFPRYTRFDVNVDGQTLSFMTNDSVTLNQVSGTSYSASNITLVQGRNVSEKYVVNTSDKNQRFLISNQNVDTSTLVVRVINSSVDSTTRFFTAPDNVVTLTGDSLVYFLEEVEDGKFEIFFGDDVIGKALETGNIVYIEYLVSEGAVGNGVLNNFAFVSSIAQVSAATFTTTNPSSGGDARESIARIKFNAPKSYSAQNRVVTSEDYLALMLKQPNVSAASVWGGEDNDPPAYGKVFIAVKPTVGTVLSPTEKENIINSVINKKKVLTVTTEIVDPEYLYLLITVSAKFDPSITTLSNSTLSSLITDTVKKFNDDEIDNFSKYFRYSVLSRLVDMTERSILNNDITVRLRKEVDVQLGVPTRYEILFANPISDVTNGRPASHPYGVGNQLTSNEFTYLGYTNCYLEENNGIIRIYRRENSSNVGVVINAGTLNYETGKVILNNFSPTAFADGGTTLKLTASPKNKDVLPLRNQIIQIRDADISVTLVDDRTISLVNR